MQHISQYISTVCPCLCPLCCCADRGILLLIVCGVSALVLILVVSLALKWKVSRENGNASTLISEQILSDVSKDRCTRFKLLNSKKKKIMCCVYPASSEPKKKSESRCEWLVQLFLKPSMENVLSIQIHLKKKINLDSRAALCD